MLTLFRVDNGHQWLVDARHCRHNAEKVNLAAAHPHHKAQEGDRLELAIRAAIERSLLCGQVCASARAPASALHSPHI